ncbi:MAG: hypothetical protein ACON4Z_17190 [Planctomycetota bacterium]
MHGPSEPGALLVSLLENGFAGLGISPGPRAVEWAAVRAAADDLPVTFAGVRAAGPLVERGPLRGFASDSEGERQVALRAIADAVQTARLLGVPQVVLDLGVVPIVGEVEAEDLGDPAYEWTAERAQALAARRRVGRDAAVDRACRGLFEVLKRFPDMSFCLTQSRSLRAVLDVDAMRDICEDLGHRGLGYWHDAAVCARREQVLAEPQGEWLEAFGNRLRGMTLGDASPDGLYLPPGAGGVDYGLCASYVPQSGTSFPCVLELDPAVSPGEMAGMRSCLDKHGF